MFANLFIYLGGGGTLWYHNYSWGACSLLIFISNHIGLSILGVTWGDDKNPANRSELHATPISHSSVLLVGLHFRSLNYYGGRVYLARLLLY